MLFPENLNIFSLFSSLLGKLTGIKFSRRCAFNNFARMKLLRWLLLKNFAGINLHEFVNKPSWIYKKRKAVKLSTREDYYSKLLFFIVNIVNNLPAGQHLRMFLLSLFRPFATVGAYNSPKLIKTNQLFRIFPYKKELTVLQVLLTQQILLFEHSIENNFITCV